MNIVVCMKQVPDPETSLRDFSFDRETGRVEARGGRPVLNPDDESALEAALRINEGLAGAACITVVSAGHKLSRNLFVSALAAGADRLVLVEDDRLAPDLLDSWATVRVLAGAVRTLGPCDLLLTGQQAADWNAGQVGIGLAQVLGCAAIAVTRRITVADGAVLAERAVEDGCERLRARLPAVVTVSSEFGALRLVPVRDVVLAKKRPVTVWGLGDIGVDAQSLAPRLVVRELLRPEPPRRRGILVGGDSPADCGRQLAERLIADGVVSTGVCAPFDKLPRNRSARVPLLTKERPGEVEAPHGKPPVVPLGKGDGSRPLEAGASPVGSLRVSGKA